MMSTTNIFIDNGDLIQQLHQKNLLKTMENHNDSEAFSEMGLPLYPKPLKHSSAKELELKTSGSLPKVRIIVLHPGGLELHQKMKMVDRNGSRAILCVNVLGEEFYLYTVA